MGGFVYRQVAVLGSGIWKTDFTLEHYRHIVSAWAEKESTKGPENAGIVLDG